MLKFLSPHSRHWWSGCVALFLGAGLFATGAAAAVAAARTPGKSGDDFMPYVQLAPFVVEGKQLAISIHARSKRDRHYAEDFAEETVKVVYEGVTPETGKGLVIIGAKGEPHPLVFFRQFLALAKEGKLDPEVAARVPELNALLGRWQATVDEGKDGDGGVDLEGETILAALPMPLEGVGAKLYQLAWREDFDEALDRLVAQELKEDGAGFIERTAAKGVMMVIKPKLRKLIAAVRQGVLFMTVAEARTTYGEQEISSLTGAYIDALMPDHDKEPGTEHERAVRAVKQEVRRLQTQAAPADPANTGP